jgi:hypothetical protein
MDDQSEGACDAMVFVVSCTLLKAEDPEKSSSAWRFGQLRFPIVFTDSYLRLQNLRAKFCHILFAAYAAPRESYWVMLCGVLAE